MKYEPRFLLVVIVLALRKILQIHPVKPGLQHLVQPVLVLQLSLMKKNCNVIPQLASFKLLCILAAAMHSLTT
jgi:hypothetical protein